MLSDSAIKCLVEELRKLPTETEWVEFKVDNCDADMIAQDISALANSAVYHGVPHAYLIWGIDDRTHDIVGTSFNYRLAKRGNEELENWLHHQLSDNAFFEFASGFVDEKPVVVLKVQPAYYHTVNYESFAYIRIGSYTKKLKDYPAVEASVWSKITRSNYESAFAKVDLSPDSVLGHLEFPKYFALQGVPIPSNQGEVLGYLCKDGIIGRQDDGRYSITNLGALLLANNLGDFPMISRKALRIVQYRGARKIEMLRERTSTKGYACDFEAAIEYILALSPSSEVIESALRQKVTAYPEIAIRELLANALIHQDLTINGTGPVVELFDDRIEFTNPGSSLVDVLRLVDNPPCSRNPQLAKLMRRFRICEELGTGWDKIIDSCEKVFLPAPKITTYVENGGSMKVALHSYTPYSQMTADDRMMACYWHACICYTGNEAMSNQSLRSRFGEAGPSASTISRLIKETLTANLIKAVDPDTAPRYMSYVPVWA